MAEIRLTDVVVATVLPWHPTHAGTLPELSVLCPVARGVGRLITGNLQGMGTSFTD